jgi:putative glycosyltransferase (TIGR04348 family)
MKIFLACPAPPRSRKGNRVSAVRWAGILKGLGHRQTIGQQYDGQACDLMVALHARKSAQAIRSYRRLYPHKPLVLCLTGTDLYRDIRTSKAAQRSLELADRLVVLQECGREELPARLHGKVRVIVQSAEATGLRPDPSVDHTPFLVSVLGHLRHEKDPFRTALALRLLPREVRGSIWVMHLGEALTSGMRRRAKRVMAVEPRYQWLGEVSRRQARRTLARSHLMVISSRMEGGANVVCEALADGVPILASRISGNVGLLGTRYPGYFPVEDTEALAQLLLRAVQDRKFYAKLKTWCVGLAPLVEPAREHAAWESLLAELVQGGTP